MPAFVVVCSNARRDGGRIGSATRHHMTTWKVIFTCKGCIAPFTETVEADTADQAREKVKQLVAAHGLKLKQITAVVQQ
jgi:hypothetical protein